MKRTFGTFLCGALLVATIFGVFGTARAQTITFVGSTTSSNYSNTGLNLGTAGYWFANFAATTPVVGAASDSNDREALPSWVAPINGTPDTTFPGTATSSGGHTTWAFLTLPNGVNWTVRRYWWILPRLTIQIIRSGNWTWDRAYRTSSISTS